MSGAAVETVKMGGRLGRFLSDGETVVLTKDVEQVHGGPYRSYLLFP